jgi:hypothetical protein
LIKDKVDRHIALFVVLSDIVFQDTSSGYVAWAYNTIANKDAVVVQLLRRAGAILYVKTANPQTLLVSSRYARHCIPILTGHMTNSRWKQKTIYLAKLRTHGTER